MSNVKAGVAYVDVRLGSIEQFKNKLKSEIESATQEVSKRVGEKLAKDMAPAGTTAGKTTAGALSKAFFQDANSSFKGGLRALFTGQFGIFSKMMKEAGAASALGLRTGFSAGISGMGSIFSRAASGVKTAAASMTSSVISGFRSIPGHIATAGKAVDNFGKKMGFLSFQLQGFGTIASLAFTAPVAAALGLGAVVGIKTAAQIEQATASLKALTPAGTDVEALVKRLQALAIKSPIFNTTDLITFTQKMVASGLSIKDTEAFLKGFGNVALTVGADVGKIPFALEAVVQMVGKGKVSMEELRQQLGDALPGAMKLVADGLGVTTKKLYDMVKAGDITGEDIVKAFTKLGSSSKYLDGAGKSADTLGSKWQALKENLQTQLGNIFLENSDKIKAALDKLGPVFKDLVDIAKPIFGNMVDGFGKFIDKIKELVDWYKKLSPSQKDMVNKFIAFLFVLGPLTLAAAGLGMIIAGLSALFAAIATPVGLVILAIIAFGVEAFLVVKKLKKLYDEGGKFKEMWDKMWKAVTDLLKPLKEEWDKIWPDIKDGFNQIKDALSQAKDGFGDFKNVAKTIGSVLMITLGPAVAIVYGIIKGVISAIGPLVKAIASFVSGIIKFLSGLITFLSGVFTGDWDQALKGLRLIWDGLWDAIVGTLVNLGKALWNLVKGIVTGIVDFFKWLWNILVGHSIIPDLVNAIIEWFKTMVKKGVELVKKLGAPFVAFYNSYIKPFIDKIKSGAGKAWDYIGGLKDKIVNGFKSAGSWLINAGKNIVNGLIDGVKKMAGTLKNAILNLIPKPVRSIVADALGIASPSKVFMEYGKNVVLGFIEGVSRLEPAMAGEVGRAFTFSPPPSVSPFYGDASRPAIDPRSAPKAAVLIENYHENGSDPDEIAEDLWFKIQSRGGGF